MLSGLARFMTDTKLPTGSYVSGLDANQGAITYNSIEVDEDGEYVLTINIKKKGAYEKYLIAKINDDEEYEILFPPQKTPNVTARFQVIVRLKQGRNVIKLFNPVTSNADSEMYQYIRMGKALQKATAKVAKERKQKEKPIVFSICEWGWASRTTGAQKLAICGARRRIFALGGGGLNSYTNTPSNSTNTQARDITTIPICSKSATENSPTIKTYPTSRFGA